MVEHSSDETEVDFDFALLPGPAEPTKSSLSVWIFQTSTLHVRAGEEAEHKTHKS